MVFAGMEFDQESGPPTAHLQPSLHAGRLPEVSPLDTSPVFQRLCEACRRGDLRECHEAISSGANINGRDAFDYTPLVCASLCGHYEVVQLLLESGAVCERATFEGERCLHNALNDRIRTLLLQYDYAKSSDQLLPFASHIATLLSCQSSKLSDIRLLTDSDEWKLHKFILATRSSYFSRKLTIAPATCEWKPIRSLPSEAFRIVLRYIYLSDIRAELGAIDVGIDRGEAVLKAIEKISRQLEIPSLWEGILASNDRRLARQIYQEQVALGREQFETWYRGNVLEYQFSVHLGMTEDIKWTRDNCVFADVLLQADETEIQTYQKRPHHNEYAPDVNHRSTNGLNNLNQSALSGVKNQPRSILFPTHRAILSRSEYFSVMFASSFSEARESGKLPVIKVDTSPETLRLILDYLYTEKVDIPIEIALDLLFAADMLFIEGLKNKAALVISTVGMAKNLNPSRMNKSTMSSEIEVINIYDVIHAAWLLNVQRLEAFSARYFAYNLEDYIDEQEFESLIKESAFRIENRQETDSIELLDDIRYYLSERFRLRFEELGLDEIMNESWTEAALPNAGVEEGEANCENLPAERDDSGNSTSIAPQDSLRDAKFRMTYGDKADDGFSTDATSYQVLIGKIEALLDRLKLGA
ncbi:BgTH12-03249 [Blumeria graminis f. sp. triticale]|uniref:BgTH12-03249 n=1 Tax=Blumeria graminis f. sp. triticale TaxID=1689686 RepID=A0A9W4GFH3_BLUGR|nr:BgTH12-03249 [Blumeria graminis f. sp. triticale]